ncbi:MAG: IPT/TIG domain-containing protein, partial [Verrucomicrobiota bacterium]
MELTAAHFWIVKSPVLIEPGVTVRVGPGTQMQWGGVSDSPYNPGPQNGNIIVRGNLRVEGTSSQPVSFFPSYLVEGKVVTISVEGAGTADMTFVKVRNPNLNGLRKIDHGYFDWDWGGSSISAQVISNSIFHKLRGGGGISAQLFDGCLFDAGWLVPNSAAIRNCTFLQDNENNIAISITAPASMDMRYFGGIPQNDDGPVNSAGTWVGLCHAVANNGFTYVTLPAEHSTQLQEAELIAQYFGGHVTSIAGQEEQTFLESYLSGTNGALGPSCVFLIGLTAEVTLGNYRWMDGLGLSYANWDSGYPVALSGLANQVVAIANLQGWAGWPGREVAWVGPWRNLGDLSADRANRWYGAGPAFILKLPGNWTAAQLNAQVVNGNVLRFLRPRMRGQIIYNAFLSKYWDPNLSHWMRVLAGGGNYASMNFNYWGTTDLTLINNMIVDYYDNFISSRVDYSPAPTNGYATTYPFVERVSINGSNAEAVPTVEAGRANFAVTFNRDMNTNVEPFVTFGPTSPHTDFLVMPRDQDFVRTTNGWLNPRTWCGAVWLTPVTGNGYHLMRISGAVAADDPWLVTGYDVGRFRFKVATSTAASMALQAEGLEGAIQLTWQQNDYDLLAGYNLYRSTNIAGPFEKLNGTVIPPNVTTYTDTNAAPAVPMFYAFTVTSTDFAESELSSIVSAAALDTLPPVLTHTPVMSALPARGLRLTATATDNLRVSGVTIFYRLTGSGSNYTSMAMINVTGSDWSATIPGSAVQSPGVEYYLTATDGISEVFSGTPLLPHVVLVSNVPTLGSVTPNHGSSAGGTAVTLSGTLFEPGVGVLFGGMLASNVTVTSANQLTCSTPPHFPGLVDVTVMNTNG